MIRQAQTEQVLLLILKAACCKQLTKAGKKLSEIGTKA